MGDQNFPALRKQIDDKYTKKLNGKGSYSQPNKVFEKGYITLLDDAELQSRTHARTHKEKEAAGVGRQAVSSECTKQIARIC